MPSYLARSCTQSVPSKVGRLFSVFPIRATASRNLASLIPATWLFDCDRRWNSSMVAEFRKASVGLKKRPLFWTSESNPANHTTRHEGFFYTVPNEHFTRWMSRGQCEHFNKVMKAFNEACLMVRAPATEVIQCIKSTNMSMPVIRYVFYGRHGCGRSVSLAHVMHFCGTQNWIVAHMPWAASLNRYCKEVQYSTYRPGRVDQPLDAAQWLAYFRSMNEPLLQNLSVSAGRYVWSKREVAEVGTPLLEVIEFGLNRVKYSTDVMGAILKELRVQASEGKVQVLVAVDGVNAFWSTTNIKQEDNRHRKHLPEELTIVHNWKKLLRNDWNNGAVVCTVDGNAIYPADLLRYLPLDLLGKDGFELLDPFIPINVTEYNDREIYSCIEYYTDRKWIQNPRAETEEGRNELVALSNRNPLELYKLAVHW